MKSKRYTDKRLKDLYNYIERYFKSTDEWKRLHNDKNFVTRTELLTVAALIVTVILGVLALIIRK